MSEKKRYKNLLQFVFQYYYIFIIAVVLFFVGIFASYSFFFAPSKYIYVKIRVGQGLWWANTLKPGISIGQPIVKGEKSYNYIGNMQAEIINVRQYPSNLPNQYDIDAIIKLKVNQNKKTETYTFNRSTVAVGSPIEIVFPSFEITGSILDISTKPITYKYTDKIITLINQAGYNKDFPYRYDEIKIGDKYFDGEEYVFEVLDKKLERNIWTIANLLQGTAYEQNIVTTQNIIVRAKVRVRKVKNDLYYGDDYKIITGGSIPFSTHTFFFEGFQIRKIE